MGAVLHLEDQMRLAGFGIIGLVGIAGGRLGIVVEPVEPADAAVPDTPDGFTNRIEISGIGTLRNPVVAET